jgi:hypothetical protein
MLALKTLTLPLLLLLPLLLPLPLVLAQATLRPDVKVYVEWSNEAWHTGFAGALTIQATLIETSCALPKSACLRHDLPQCLL